MNEIGIPLKNIICTAWSKEGKGGHVERAVRLGVRYLPACLAHDQLQHVNNVRNIVAGVPEL